MAYLRMLRKPFERPFVLWTLVRIGSCLLFEPFETHGLSTCAYAKAIETFPIARLRGAGFTTIWTSHPNRLRSQIKRS